MRIQYDTSEKVVFIVFYLMVMAVLGFMAYAIVKNKLKHPLYKFTLVVSIIGLIFCTLWISSVFMLSENLNRFVMLFAAILLPFLWFFGALGFIIYGLAAIITRKTYVKYASFLLPSQAQGVEAMYLGVLWVIAGSMMILMEVAVANFVLCENNHWYCPILGSAENIFEMLGNLLSILVKPLEYLRMVPQY